MDPILAVLEQFGLPVAMLVAFGYYIWRQNQWIQNDLTKDIHSKFNRIHDVCDKDLRNIIIALINNAKKNEIRLASIERSHKAVIEVIARLSGNGLRHKLENMLKKQETENDY
tara:strand:+ start:18258 stop:18596 length:339 start_codon:yes stop_codon:yes gene_type:complete